MLSKATLQFLKDLAENNNREWFNDNKPRFKEAQGEFIGLVAQLIGRISVFDPPIARLNPEKSIFRIYRDTRFSKDKTPYKTNFGAHLVDTAAKVHDRAGYYIHLEPGQSFLAGGAYLPPGPWINAIRESIDKRGSKLEAILAADDFKKLFGGLSGDKLKTSPRNYPADHPRIELLRYKSFLAVHNFRDELITSNKFIDHAAQVFEALKPLDDFLNQSLGA